MAGFFGLFDYSKPGKGVRKDEPQKGRFVHFFELLFRKFWKLIQLNLLYLLFCIPIVTIGPATAGFTYVARNLANEQPVFLFSDFWDAFRQNWKQSLAFSAISLACTALITVAVRFYFHNAPTSGILYVPLALSLFLGLLFTMASYYIYLMIVTLDLNLRSILKNGLIFAIVCLKTNLLTFLFTGIILVATVLFFPISLLFVFFLVPALVGFIICYNSYPGIKKYAIDPYLEAHGDSGDPGGGDSTLFSDDEPVQTN